MGYFMILSWYSYSLEDGQGDDIQGGDGIYHCTPQFDISETSHYIQGSAMNVRQTLRVALNEGQAGILKLTIISKCNSPTGVTISTPTSEREAIITWPLPRS